MAVVYLNSPLSCGRSKTTVTYPKMLQCGDIEASFSASIEGSCIFTRQAVVGSFTEVTILRNFSLNVGIVQCKRIYRVVAVE